MAVSIHHDVDNAMILFEVSGTSSTDDIMQGINTALNYLNSTDLPTAIIGDWTQADNFPSLRDALPTAQQMVAHMNTEYVCYAGVSAELAFWLQVLNKQAGRTYIKFETMNEAISFVKKAREVSTKRIPPK